MTRYKCPNCGGEFDSWDKPMISAGAPKKQCPFCGKKKGQYGPQL